MGRREIHLAHVPRFKNAKKILVMQILLFSCPVKSDFFCDPMDYNPPDSSVLGILQARILKWVAIALFQGIFLTQGLNLFLLHHRWILYH